MADEENLEIDEGVEPELTELSVRYTGDSDKRVMSQQDLSGVGGDIHEDHQLEDAEWVKGSTVPMSVWEEMAGSPERAREVLNNHSHEFELVGPGAEDWGKEDEELPETEDNGTSV